MLATALVSSVSSLWTIQMQQLTQGTAGSAEEGAASGRDPATHAKALEDLVHALKERDR